ncbi:hypothetical protein [Acetobacter sp. P5B1]|uniref:hypothetical protein n=1 Tax=Acetobacter sp. P5B1 TaxID=2762620 RepID=UPI001C047C11|nr:hypothetical protein [Acetobacter sp. P5B1]
MKKLLTAFAFSALVSASALAGPNHDRPEFKKLSAQPQPQKTTPSAPVTPGAPTTGK